MFLENINSPGDLKQVPLVKLPELASEIRSRILEVVSANGGHLASSLGAVELAIALHYCLDVPSDKIIWDVGHQSYAHKILTGRNKDFSSLRKFQGLSGFPCKNESGCDPFTTGHSSSAVSLALGLALARENLNPPQQYKVVAVIGDGSLSGGLCFEGLNNAGHIKKDIAIVLNTNEMSIAPNVGAISNYLNKIISTPVYNRFHESLENLIKSRFPKGSRLLRLVNKFEEALKGLFIPGMFFEEMGFRYFGPFDGHNLGTLIPAFKKILAIKGPILLHVVTKKGKGYLPAEKDPVRFHGTGPFDVATGNPAQAGFLQPRKTYTEVFSGKMLELAQKHPELIAITAAMPEGTGLDKFRDAFPGRFFDVGIAEQHAVCFAAGLAKQGLVPVVALYSTFLQRAYDQLIEDIGLQEAAVVLAIDRAGIVGEDGPTHQGIFDISFLRGIPNFVVMAPKDARELEAMLELAIGLKKPVAIRYPKSWVADNLPSLSALEVGKAEILSVGRDFLLVALGSMVYSAWEAVKILEKDGINGTLVNARFVKPLDAPALKKLSCAVNLICTLEEAVIDGGFGSLVMEQIDKPVKRMGLPDEFIPCGKRAELLDKYGLSPKQIAAQIRLWLK
ncbi:MAG: 1-deoxy-D-xylulose-5-phosphate synthase [Candidatus Omnitrophica bacterium]|jgi:1-deoxy-D-xylulose-5-phosphate synthase|nr:1-deoxy-D-xylulose-5-phosphate synthase [Candidatus Omnitrophota bacterium]